MTRDPALVKAALEAAADLLDDWAATRDCADRKEKIQHDILRQLSARLRGDALDHAAIAAGVPLEPDEQDTENAKYKSYERLRARVAELEERLFKCGSMAEAPCFMCGYNGPGYFQPATHPCAARHHAAMEEVQP